MRMQQRLRQLLDSGQDNALLRFSLGELLYKQDRPGEAVEHLARAVAHDPEYSAAYKLYGKALIAIDEYERALATLAQGIEVAQRRGDNQAAREMQVFVKRAEKHGGRG